MDFERIDDEHQRAKVHGGWIVKAFENVMTTICPGHNASEGYEWRVAMCFVPDPQHEWQLNKMDNTYDGVTGD